MYCIRIYARCSSFRSIHRRRGEGRGKPREKGAAVCASGRERGRGGGDGAAAILAAPRMRAASLWALTRAATAKTRMDSALALSPHSIDLAPSRSLSMARGCIIARSRLLQSMNALFTIVYAIKLVISIRTIGNSVFLCAAAAAPRAPAPLYFGIFYHSEFLRPTPLCVIKLLTFRLLLFNEEAFNARSARFVIVS